MTSRSATVGSTKTSYIDFSTVVGVEIRHRTVGLRVEIDQQRALLAQREPGGQVDGGGRLADAALLVGDCDDHALWDRNRAILGRRSCAVSRTPLHLVAHVVRIEALQPPLQPVLVGLIGRDLEGPGLVEHRRRARRSARGSARPARARRWAAHRPESRRRPAAVPGTRRRCSPFRSAMMTRETVTPSAPTTSRSRSCVIGRGGDSFRSAARWRWPPPGPTQIGSTRCPSASRRITIGTFVTGSSISPLTCISTSMDGSCASGGASRASPRRLFGPCPVILTSIDPSDLVRRARAN